MIPAPVRLAAENCVFCLSSVVIFITFTFKGFVLWTILLHHRDAFPLTRLYHWCILFRIFRVALLFICQGTDCFAACLIRDSLVSLSQVFASVKRFFIFLNWLFLFGLYLKSKSPRSSISFLPYFSATKIILPRHFPYVNNKFHFFP